MCPVCPAAWADDNILWVCFWISCKCTSWLWWALPVLCSWMALLQVKGMVHTCQRCKTLPTCTHTHLLTLTQPCGLHTYGKEGGCEQLPLGLKSYLHLHVQYSVLLKAKHDYTGRSSIPLQHRNSFDMYWVDAYSLNMPSGFFLFSLFPQQTEPRLVHQNPPSAELFLWTRLSDPISRGSGPKRQTGQ